MHEIRVETLDHRPVGQQQFEYVERKGLGHPDSICDAVMEAVSLALGQAYLQTAGHLLHYNLDKGLLVAGQTTPALGGGRVEVPMRLVFGDRATRQFDQGTIPVDEIAETTARQWFADHLRFVDPQQHLVFQNEIKSGSPELVDIFARQQIVANDTSAAVGYAPKSEAELLVLAAERWLNSADVKARFPETGEDVKVMGVRQGGRLHLTIAVAFVDRFVEDQQTYERRKEEVCHELRQHLNGELTHLDSVELHFNTLDQPDRGLAGMYLTVLGTSAESGDGGEVGRGNPANGVISLNRPISNEAAAGKNPASHVGKIYNLFSYQVAEAVYQEVDGVEEAYVWLCSQIGRPVELPWFTSAAVVLASDAIISDVDRQVRQVVSQQLAGIPDFCQRLLRGELGVC